MNYSTIERTLYFIPIEMSSSSSGRKNESDDSAADMFSGNTKYVLGAIIFGAAVGNIFLAKRMKNIKINFYKAKSSNSSSNNSSNSEGPNVRGSANSDPSSSSRFNHNRTHHSQTQPSTEEMRRLLEVSGYLLDLSLPTDKFPTSDDVKEAYREVALLYHPDKVKDKKLLHKSKDKFSKATIAKNKLLELLDKI